jgi:hypothetical protein
MMDLANAIYQREDTYPDASWLTDIARQLGYSGAYEPPDAQFDWTTPAVAGGGALLTALSSGTGLPAFTGFMAM